MATTLENLETAKEPQRVTVSLPPDAIDFLKEEAKRTGMSMADILRRSIATEKFIQSQRREGAELLVHPKGSDRASKLVFKD
jgi:intracellular sulfur oxidation DsrE/DsrF family protein